MRNHTEILNKILAHSCSNPLANGFQVGKGTTEDPIRTKYPADCWREYRIDLCCMNLVIVARPVTGEGASTEFEISEIKEVWEAFK